MKYLYKQSAKSLLERFENDPHWENSYERRFVRKENDYYVSVNVYNKYMSPNLDATELYAKPYDFDTVIGFYNDEFTYNDLLKNFDKFKTICDKYYNSFMACVNQLLDNDFKIYGKGQPSAAFEKFFTLNEKQYRFYSFIEMNHHKDITMQLYDPDKLLLSETVSIDNFDISICDKMIEKQNKTTSNLIKKRLCKKYANSVSPYLCYNLTYDKNKASYLVETGDDDETNEINKYNKDVIDNLSDNEKNKLLKKLSLSDFDINDILLGLEQTDIPSITKKLKKIYYLEPADQAFPAYMGESSANLNIEIGKHFKSLVDAILKKYVFNPEEFDEDDVIEFLQEKYPNLDSYYVDIWGEAMYDYICDNQK